MVLRFVLVEVSVVNTNSKDGIEQLNDPIEITPNKQHGRGEISEINEEFYPIFEQVKKALKSGQFNNALRQNIIKLDKFINVNGSSLKTTDELLYLKTKCLLAEAYDYFGQMDSSGKLLSEGSEIFDQLKALEDVELDNRKITRERIRFCLNHANAFLYRAYKYEAAKQRILWCRDFVNDKLRDEKAFPCYGTLAQAEFFLGRTYRRLNQYDEAEKCFGQAIEYYYQRAKKKKRRVRK